MNPLWIVLIVLGAVAAYFYIRAELVHRFRKELAKVGSAQPDYEILWKQQNSVDVRDMIYSFRSFESFYEGTRLLDVYRAEKRKGGAK